jgi:phospholipase/carboxylesterase
MQGLSTAPRGTAAAARDFGGVGLYARAMPLETIEIEPLAGPKTGREPGPAPDAAVIWLHGLGADGNDFVPVVPELVRPGERAWRFVFPHAPERPVTLNGGMRMRAWYDILSLDRRALEDDAGFRATDRAVRELIAQQVQRGISAARIVLAGFSQGAAVSLFTALRYPERLAGVMALSGYLPLASRLAAERAQANHGTPIFMAHGMADAVLPIGMGLESRGALQAQGYAVEWHQYPMAHSLCAAEVTDMRQFLLRVLPNMKVS